MNACHDLDVKLAEVSVPVEAKKTYMCYAAQLADVRDAKERMAVCRSAAESLQQMALHFALRQSAKDVDTVALVTRLLSEAQQQQLKADSLVSACMRMLFILHCMRLLV